MFIGQFGGYAFEHQRYQTENFQLYLYHCALYHSCYFENPYKHVFFYFLRFPKLDSNKSELKVCCFKSYLLLDSRWPPSTEEIIFRLKVSSPTLETSTSPRLVHLLKVVIVDDPGINTELVLLRLVAS